MNQDKLKIVPASECNKFTNHIRWCMDSVLMNLPKWAKVDRSGCEIVEIACHRDSAGNLHALVSLKNGTEINVMTGDTAHTISRLQQGVLAYGQSNNRSSRVRHSVQAVHVHV